MISIIKQILKKIINLIIINLIIRIAIIWINLASSVTHIIK